MTIFAVLVSSEVSGSLCCSDDAGSGGGSPSLALARFTGGRRIRKVMRRTSASQNTKLTTATEHSLSTQNLRETLKRGYSQYLHPKIRKTYVNMPPVRTARASKKAPPEGFEDIEDTLLEFQNKMKDAENASHEGKKKYEMTWPIFQITHQRSKYIYDLYYEKEAISKQLYDYLLKNGYADAMLIAKWKKQGYEKVCTTGAVYVGALLTSDSFAAQDASRPRRPTSARHVFVEYRAKNLMRIRIFSASIVAAEAAHQAIE